MKVRALLIFSWFTILTACGSQALSCYSQAEQLNQGRPLSDDYFSLICSIGKLHTKLGDHRKAAAYLEKGME